MNKQPGNRRIQRQAKLCLESLDERIMPSTIHAAASTGAEKTATISVARRHEKHLAMLEAKQERAALRHALRLARREARHHAQHSQTTAPATAKPETMHVLSLAHGRSSVLTPRNRSTSPAAARTGGSSVSGPQLLATSSDPGPGTPASMTSPQSPSPGSAPSARNVPSEAPPPSTSSSLPPNVAQPLQKIYGEFQDGGNITSSNGIVISGSDVGVQVKSNNTGDFSDFVAQLQSAGLKVIVSDARYGIVVGMVSITQLPDIATLPQSLSVSPMYYPKLL